MQAVLIQVASMYGVILPRATRCYPAAIEHALAPSAYPKADGRHGIVTFDITCDAESGNFTRTWVGRVDDSSHGRQLLRSHCTLNEFLSLNGLVSKIAAAISTSFASSVLGRLVACGEQT